MTMASSILHRVTGCAIYVGSFLIVAWLFAAASGPDLYEPMASLIGSIWGQLILFGFTLAMTYHLLNGVRHLSMDAGKGFNPKFASFTAGVVLVLAVILSVAIWMLAGLVPGVDPLHMTTVTGAAQ
jgi:succinate dehydrogenase / fumarate reductase cytochrome b subunit